VGERKSSRPQRAGNPCRQKTLVPFEIRMDGRDKNATLTNRWPLSAVVASRVKRARRVIDRFRRGRGQVMMRAALQQILSPPLR